VPPTRPPTTHMTRMRRRPTGLANLPREALHSESEPLAIIPVPIPIGIVDAETAAGGPTDTACDGSGGYGGRRPGASARALPAHPAFPPSSV
jgi:hypothetical protein